MNKIPILVPASTFPRKKNDNQSDFVLQQLTWIQRIHPEFQFYVLAPHEQNSRRVERFGKIVVIRYRYFFPLSRQKLAYPAILPNLQQSPLLYFQVPFLMLALLLSSLYLCKREKIKLIYSHWFLPQGVVCSLTAKLMKLPHLLTSHSSDVLVLSRIPFIGKPLCRFFLRTFKEITVVSSRGEKIIKECLKEEDPLITRLPMGIDPAFFDLPVEAPKDSKTSTILFVGRLAEKKGVSFLLDSLAPLLNPTLRLRIMGEGPLASSLKQQAEELGIHDYVEFLGHLAGEKKLKEFQNASLFVLPSIILSNSDAEGLPVSLLEAMAAGKICIASEVSGAPDIIEHNKTGFLYLSDNPTFLQEAIKYTGTLSAAQKESISFAARKSASTLSWPELAKQYTLLLQSEL